jgi:LysR family transcriptional regulator of beta-lactamase
MIEAAQQGAGVALAPTEMFRRDLLSGRLARPFETDVVLGAYWITWLKSKELSIGMLAFRRWLVETVQSERAVFGLPVLP